MCMTKEMATKLGEVIEKIKEVETNAAGEYFEQFLRLRIIANVTKLLKKKISVPLVTLNSVTQSMSLVRMLLSKQL